MLIETDPIDWNKPIVWFDPVSGVVLPALLVSRNYKTSVSSPAYYCVVIYNKNGDKVEYVQEDGRISSSNPRKVFNHDSPPEKDLALTDAAQKTIKGLGDF